MRLFERYHPITVTSNQNCLFLQNWQNAESQGIAQLNCTVFIDIQKIIYIYIFFNFFQVSQLVVSEIVRRSNMASRIAAIEKWAAVADISRCLHNFNGVLQVCAAFTNSSVFRLKKTWEKVSKTVYISCLHHNIVFLLFSLPHWVFYRFWKNMAR
jgi:hypothetical protein